MFARNDVLNVKRHKQRIFLREQAIFATALGAVTHQLAKRWVHLMRAGLIQNSSRIGLEDGDESGRMHVRFILGPLVVC